MEKKILKEYCYVISIYYLKKIDVLKGEFVTFITYGRTGGDFVVQVNISMKKLPSVTLRYSIPDSRSSKLQEVSMRFRLTSTRCNYGSHRYFFLCSCGKRVANLYMGTSNRYFTCRHCCDLTYYSRVSGWSYSEPKIQKYKDGIKRWYYKGLPTKKHSSYLKKKRILHKKMVESLQSLHKMIGRKNIQYK